MLEIGIAISVYGLFVIITIMIQLGVEYPLLRKNQVSRIPVCLGPHLHWSYSYHWCHLTVFFFIANFHQNLINQDVVNDLI